MASKLNKAALDKTVAEIQEVYPGLYASSIRTVIERCLELSENDPKYVPESEGRRTIWLAYKKHAGLT